MPSSQKREKRGAQLLKDRKASRAQGQPRGTAGSEVSRRVPAPLRVRCALPSGRDPGAAANRKRRQERESERPGPAALSLSGLPHVPEGGGAGPGRSRDGGAGVSHAAEGVADRADRQRPLPGAALGEPRADALPHPLEARGQAGLPAAAGRRSLQGTASPRDPPPGASPPASCAHSPYIPAAPLGSPPGRFLAPPNPRSTVPVPPAPHCPLPRPPISAAPAPCASAPRCARPVRPPRVCAAPTPCAPPDPAVQPRSPPRTRDARPPNLSPPILSSPALCPLDPKSPPAPAPGSHPPPGLLQSLCPAQPPLFP